MDGRQPSKIPSVALPIRNHVQPSALFVESMSLCHKGSERTVSPFISTGITAPVGRRNSRCPMTLSIEVIDPEWVVNEMYVLLSWVNISSSSFFIRVWIVIFRVSIPCSRGLEDFRKGRKISKTFFQNRDLMEMRRNTYIVNRMSLSNVRLPQLILLGKFGFKSVCWEFVVNIGFAATPVTSMDPDHFAQQFLNFWHEGLLRW